MANGEWMNQLIAGLGGAFTGAGQARSRMAEEAEAERKKMETENERARLKRIQELRGGGFSDASARELLSLGETPGNVESLRDLFTPKAKPTYEERKEDGGVAIYKDGQFSGWKRQPPKDREVSTSPDRLTPAQARAERGRLQSDVEQSQAAFLSLMRQRPKRADFIGEPAGAAERALQGFQAESLLAERVRQAAPKRLQQFEQEYGFSQESPMAGAPVTSRQMIVERDARSKMAEIDMDPTLNFQQKQEMKRRVQAQANKFLNP
jgi:hypothetical protein